MAFAGIREARQEYPMGYFLKLCAFIAVIGIACGNFAAGQQVPEGANQTSPTLLQPIPAAPATNEIAGQILNRALLESVWGKPAYCDVRQSVRLFDKKVSSFGKYVRGGQGSGRLRMSLQLPAGDLMNSLLQVSDGELLTTVTSVGSNSTRTLVDLGKIRERLTITTQSLRDPVVAMYLAIGGQAEVLRKLTQQYEWSKVSEGLLGEERVWWLTGSVQPQPPSQHAEAEIDAKLFAESRAGFLPQNAVIAIGHTDASVPFWLYQVEQWRDLDNRITNGTSSDLHITTEWASPSYLTPAQLLPDLFKAQPAESVMQETREETKLYLPPVTLPTASRVSATRR